MNGMNKLAMMAAPQRGNMLAGMAQAPQQAEPQPSQNTPILFTGTFALPDGQQIQVQNGIGQIEGDEINVFRTEPDGADMVIIEGGKLAGTIENGMFQPGGAQ